MARPLGSKNTVPHEDSEQIQLVAWLRRVEPRGWFHPPNGEKRSMSTATKLKAMGVESGVPDLVFPGRKLALELKRLGVHKATPTQEQWLEDFQRWGYKTAVCSGWQAARTWLESHGVGRTPAP